MKKLMCVFAILAAAVLAQPLITAQPAPVVQPAKVYATGHKTPKDIDAKMKASWDRHSHRLKALPAVTAASWDCRTLGIVPPIVDQGQCGSCWNFSGSGMATSALIKAGYGKPDGSFMLSEQYTMDCGQNGGCNGDDNTTVLAWAKATGIPQTSDYGPYQARAANCKQINAMLFYKLSDWGYCGSQNGVADTQAIKNMMVQYGPIGSAIAADNAFMNSPAGSVFKGSGSRDINHDIILCGWDDVKGAWLLRNSWGTSWCDAGYQWIKYGANQVGTEAVWCVATPLPLPPAPPVPPGPNPPPGPTPPSPLPGLTMKSISFSFTDGSSSVVDVVPAGSVTISAGMTLRDFADALDKATKSGASTAPAAPCPTAQRLEMLERAVPAMRGSIEKMEKILSGK